MSLRIKIPAQKPSASGTTEDMELPDSTKRKRQLPKRFQEALEEEEERPEPVRKARKVAGKPRRNSAADYAPEHVSQNSDHDVDVLNDINEEEAEYQDDHHSEYSAQPSVSSTIASKKSKSKTSSHAPPVRKKSRKVVVSDSELSEEEEEYKAVDDDAIPEPEDDDVNEEDFLSFADKPTKNSKGKAKAPPPKASTGTKGTKRKAKADPDEGLPETKPSTAGATKKRLKPTLQTEDIEVDVDGSNDTPEASATIEHSSPATTKHDSPVPPPLPKKKLPTIKKTKLPATPGLNTPTSAGVPPKKVPLEIAGAKGIEERKKLNLRGQTDIDLSDKSVYDNLFLKSGNADGSIPRRAKEEERRKELNRMREEAKAKRAAESVHCFDLQAQNDKISQFEEKLRPTQTLALYPNFLAGKWRDRYDQDRRRQREWDEANCANGREEGEVS